jgi:hypothetical protein
MKSLQVISSLLTSLLLGSVALAQAGSLPDAPQPQHPASTQLESSPAANTEASSQQSTPPSDESKLLSQARPYPRFPRGPMGPPRGRAYPRAFAPPPPALSPVGALIGFGFGAALGAAASGDHTSAGRVAGGLIGGGICALIGGAIGGGFSLVHSHNFRDWESKHPSRHDRRNLERPRESDVEASSLPISSKETTTEGTGDTE